MSGGIDTGYNDCLIGHSNDKLIRLSDLVINPLNYKIKSAVHGLICSAFSIGNKCYTISNLRGKNYIIDSETDESLEFVGGGNKEDFVVIDDKLCEIMLFGDVNDSHIILIDLRTRLLLSNIDINNFENLGYNFISNYSNRHRLSIFDDFYKKIDGDLVMSVNINYERCIFDESNRKRLMSIHSTKELIVDFKTISIITSSGDEYVHVQKDNLKLEWIPMNDLRVI